MLGIALCVVIMAGNWRVFQKMGRQGWEAIIPAYNSYVLFQELYGNGWRFLMILIPIYGLYIAIKANFDLARDFNQPTGFGIGLTLLPFIFLPLLGFGEAQYLDGSRGE